MKKIFGILLALALVLSFSLVAAVPVAADGTDYYVSTTGNDGNDGLAADDAHAWLTIQHAIDSVSSGDTINVAAGTYNENVDVSKSLSLVGSGTVNVTALLANDHVFEVTASYVSISGFTVTGTTAWEKAGIYLDGVNHCNISNNNASNNNCGIILWGSSNNNITNNTANSNDRWGILLQGSSGNNITNNTATNNQVGIHLRSSSNNTLTGNTASNNTDGIHLRSSSNNTLTNNTADSNSSIGIDLYSVLQPIWRPSNNNTLTNNTASNNTDGIRLWHSSNNTLTNNTANSNNTYGILLWGSSNNNTVSNNTVSSNNHGIWIMGDGNQFIGNNILNNAGSEGSGIHLSADASGNVIHFNNIVGNSPPGSGFYGVYNEAAEVVDATYNWWGSSSGPYHEILNPGGTGDTVSDYVDFEPWLVEVPTVTTQAATDITTDSAILNMGYTVEDYSQVQVRFAYKKSADSAWSYTDWVSKTADGSHDEMLTGLESDTDYDFKAQFKYDTNEIEGATLQFTTAPISGCFIATAAYGTSTAEQLDVLREFRDDVLLESTAGSQLVDLYYQVSPPVADFISESSFVRTLVRELLVDPAVWIVEATGNIWRN